MTKNEGFTFGTDPHAFDPKPTPAETEPQRVKPDKYEVYKAVTVTTTGGPTEALRFHSSHVTGKEAVKEALAGAKQRPGTAYTVFRKLEQIVVEEVTTKRVIRSN